jgi:leucyl aminopeptidase (aminopeptidase T)
MGGIDKAIHTVLVDCLDVKEGENVLVVTDPSRRSIAEALIIGARDLGADAVFAEMSERASNGTEPPPPIAAAMLESDVFVAPTAKSLSHTEARHAASQKGVRAATMPGIDEGMLIRTMTADYAEVRRRSAALAELLSNGTEVRITSPAGTDVVFNIDGRDGLSDDGDLRAPGSFGNLPAGEGFVAPVEGKTNGRIVFDGSIWPVGLLTDPLVVEVVDGYATDFSGGAAEEFTATIEPYGREAFAVAELGIGTNETATLTGLVLEDEKVLGTIHIAFGDNHSFGGQIRVSSHQDGVVLKPHVVIDGKVILDQGQLQI